MRSHLALLVLLSLSSACVVGDPGDEPDDYIEEGYDDEQVEYGSLPSETDGQVTQAGSDIRCYLSTWARRTGETSTTRRYKITWMYECSGIGPYRSDDFPVAPLQQVLKDFGPTAGGSYKAYRWAVPAHTCSTHGVCFSIYRSVPKGSCRTFNRYINAALWVPEAGFEDFRGDRASGSNFARTQCASK